RATLGPLVPRSTATTTRSWAGRPAGDRGAAPWATGGRPLAPGGRAPGGRGGPAPSGAGGRGVVACAPGPHRVTPLTRFRPGRSADARGSGTSMTPLAPRRRCARTLARSRPGVQGSGRNITSGTSRPERQALVAVG